MQGSQSSSRNACCAIEEQTPGTKYVKDIIQDLEHYGPAGLIHVIVLTNMIGKPIRIWNHDGSLNRIIGEEKKDRPIDIEYHQIDSEQIGHWTLRHGKNPENTTLDLNSCLFSVISSQTGQDPSKLRKQLIQKLRCNFEELTHLVDEIIRMKGHDEITLMIGGAKYEGKSPKDAGKILDQSQNQLSYKSNNPGHPRGHTVSKECAKSDDIEKAVEEYSQEGKKSSFLSPIHQNVVAHWALKSFRAQYDMKRLNENKTNISTFVPRKVLKEIAKNCCWTIPKGKSYKSSYATSKEELIQGVVLVMRHQQNQSKEPKADVFIQSFYPILYPEKIPEHLEQRSYPVHTGC